MKDADKIKEKAKREDFKGILIFGLVFLLAFGLIVYAIIKLTNQYFTLKEKLEDKPDNKTVVESIDPKSGKKYEYNFNGDNTNVKKIEEDVKKVTDINDLVDNKSKNNAQPEQKNVKAENKPENKDNKSTVQKEQAKPKIITLPTDNKSDQKNTAGTNKIAPQQPAKKQEAKNNPQKEEKHENKKAETKPQADQHDKTDTNNKSKQAEQNKKEEKTVKDNNDKQQNKQTTEHKKPEIKTDVADKNNKNGKTEVKKDNDKPQQTKQESKDQTNSKAYILQLIAFQDKEAAEKEAARLKADIPDVYVMKVNLGDKGIWYRVRCCYSKDKAEADQKKAKIPAKYKLNPIPLKNE